MAHCQSLLIWQSQFTSVKRQTRCRGDYPGLITSCNTASRLSPDRCNWCGMQLLEWILSRLPDASSGDVVSSLATKCLSILGDARTATSTNHYVSLEPILAYAVSS